MSRRGWVRRTAYDGPLTSGSRPDAYGRPRARHGASSFPKRPGWMCAAPRYPLRPYSSTAARGGLALGASPRPSEGSLGGDDAATMRAPPWPSTAPKALRMVLVLGCDEGVAGRAAFRPSMQSGQPVLGRRTGGHCACKLPTALDADIYARDYHSRPVDHDGLVFALGRPLW